LAEGEFHRRIAFDGFSGNDKGMTRATASSACALVGVVLVVIATVLNSAGILMTGLALLLVSHVLEPCLDRIAVWRKKLLK
jgi:hypothetical protein